MRIVAGEHRGRLLVAPKGQSTRPTADRTRQALFNVLDHAAWSRGVEGARVLDLFAGSGALGLEALSRGGVYCLFVDSDPVAAAAIGENIASLRLGDRCAVRRNDATRLSPAASGETPFDLVFLDAPYGRGLVEPALATLLTGGWLSPRALMVVERGASEPELNAPGYGLHDSRVWGVARVSFLEAPDAPFTVPPTA
jgi:16S rRNA (guanine966-N2)-methyltransferase